MEEMIKSYYAIIPANIRYDNNLTANEKLLYCEFTALSNEKGFCWPSNDYFADLYKVSDRSVSRWISNLTKKGYIVVSFSYKPGTREIIRRYIKLAGNSNEQFSFIGGDKNVNTYRQNCPIGGDKNGVDNTINNNNTIINNNSPLDDKTEKPKIDKYQRLVNLYSTICIKLPKVEKITDKRKKSIDKLLNLYTLEKIEDAFKTINSSNFCTGNNDRGWIADFDFCINADKITNALEGKYKNGPDNKPTKPTQPKSTNKFHNFEQKMAGMGESKLEEMAKKSQASKLRELKGVSQND